ncbi:phosphotransferase family protein [Amycolatopsis acidicola]|uniref:phosphotransferase family protein n=1 Tax=Amycolatopsis acidicola TaxID=2596893 RepID=UPI001FB5B5BA|nr:phosphotransferase family protein [Amycolatopsis acidicola]
MHGSVTVRRIGNGQSNLTAAVTDEAGHRWVLRRPPPGRHDRTAHDVHREVRVLTALAGSPVPVPAVVASGQDEAGIDGPFYLMEHAQGEVLNDEQDAAGLPARERLTVSRDVAGVLAALHAVSPAEVGLSDLGRPDAYLERQLARLARNWSSWTVGREPHSEWEECRTRLAARIPGQQRVVITHGDYRLSNVVVAAGRINAVLDWELCTLGDPLADLAWLADDWRSPAEPATAIPSPTRVGGFLDRDEVVAGYADSAGIDVTDLPYYRAFTHWKAATLLQGVLRRRGDSGVRGTPSSAELEGTIHALLTEALELL